jgi:hypothetical protein
MRRSIYEFVPAASKTFSRPRDRRMDSRSILDKVQASGGKQALMRLAQDATNRARKMTDVRHGSAEEGPGADERTDGSADD